MKQTQTHSLRLAVLSCLAATACGASWAQDSSAYPYFGLTLGESRAKFDQTGINQRLLGNTVRATSLSSDNKDRAYRVFGGYQFNPYIGVEAAFFDLGKFAFSSTTTPTGSLNGSTKLQGGGIDVVGTVPLGDTFALLGRVGAQYAKTRNSFTATGAATVANPRPSERAGNYKVGVGLQFAFSPGFMMRAEADRYRMKDGFGDQANVNVYSVSVVFPFGRAPMRSTRATAPAQAVAYQAPTLAPTPAPTVVPAPAPPPAMVAQAQAPAATAPMPQRMSFKAESLFGFDQARLRPEGRTALDGFAQEARGAQFQVIVVAGHADRIGSASYNQALSVERAEAVKAYLVSSGGFDASKISISGLGEGSPATKAGDCMDSLPAAQLRSCLQPDRRVEVEVNATR